MRNRAQPHVRNLVGRPIQRISRMPEHTANVNLALALDIAPSLLESGPRTRRHPSPRAPRPRCFRAALMHNLLDRLHSGYGIGLNNRLARAHLEQVFQRERQCFEFELIRARLGFSSP